MPIHTYTSVIMWPSLSLVQGSGGDYERRRGDVGLGGRANKPLPRGLAVPVNIVQGGDLNLRHIAPRPMSHSHSDIAVKTEKTWFSPYFLFSFTTNHRYAFTFRDCKYIPFALLCISLCVYVFKLYIGLAITDFITQKCHYIELNLLLWLQ